MHQDVLKQIRRLQLLAKRIVRTSFGGEYRSAFKGMGLSFEEVREYQPGDEIRLIDWNVTARMDQTFIKRYVEERELTILLLVDLSAGMRFGSAATTKRQVAAELTAVLAFAAVLHHDRIGLLTFTDRIEATIRPAKGSRPVLRLLRTILHAKPTGRETNLTAALEAVNKLQKRRAVIFVISDFQDESPERLLKRTALRHDVIAVRIDDELERAWPAVGLVRVQDPETDAMTVIDTDLTAFRTAFAAQADAQRSRFEKVAAEAGVDIIDAATDGRHFEVLLRFFRTRRRRRERQ